MPILYTTGPNMLHYWPTSYAPLDLENEPHLSAAHPLDSNPTCRCLFAYDRFRDRIMFPIRDSRGRCLGFGGRVLGNDEPKYLNSPETALYHKSRELYGLYLARQRSGRLDNIIVGEGDMDVVARAQFGFKNVDFKEDE